MIQESTSYIAGVNKFADIRNYSGEVDRKEHVKALLCFEEAFEALGGLCTFEQDAEGLKQAREKLKAKFADIIVNNEVVGEQDDRVLLIRELAQAVIGQAKLCAEFPEWKISKRSYVKDASDKVLGAAEIVGGAVGSVIAAPAFWIGTAMNAHGFRPPFNPLQLPGMLSMAGIADGFARTQNPSALSVKKIGRKIQEIAKKAEPFLNVELAKK